MKIPPNLLLLTSAGSARAFDQLSALAFGVDHGYRGKCTFGKRVGSYRIDDITLAWIHHQR